MLQNQQQRHRHMPTRFRKENARPNQDLKQERQLNGCRKFGRNIQQADAKREIAVVALGAPLVGGLPLKDYQSNILAHMMALGPQQQITNLFYRRKIKHKEQRTELLKYMYQLFKQHKLQRRTMHLAAYYLDRAQCKKPETNADQLLLLGEASLFMAMKYEQIYPPALKKWASDHENDILRVQSLIMSRLQFKLAYTSSEDLLQINMAQKQLNDAQKQMCEVLLDLYLMVGVVYQRLPSEVAQQVVEAVSDAQGPPSAVQQKIKALIDNNKPTWGFLLKQNSFLGKLAVQTMTAE